MVMVNITIKMGVFIQDIGNKTFKKILVQKYGMIIRDIQDNIQMGKKNELELIYYPMVLNIKENGEIIIQKDLVYLSIMMAKYIEANGKII